MGPPEGQGQAQAGENSAEAQAEGKEGVKEIGDHLIAEVGNIANSRINLELAILG